MSLAVKFIMSSGENIIWINGGLIPASEACISPLDRGLTLGDGVFETLRSYGGKPFAVERHWRRLAQSCEVVDLIVPTQDAFASALNLTLTANALLDARVRFTVTRGNDQKGASPTMICFATPSHSYEATERVVTVPWPRNEQSPLAGVKSISYGENLMALAYAKKQKAGEAVFFNTRGELCEGATTNIFIIKGGQVFTPPISSGCLAGVTRELVIELCHDNNISISEMPLTSQALTEADEAFLTSSTREVQPISHLNGIPFPKSVGFTSRHIVELFRNVLYHDCSL